VASAAQQSRSPSWIVKSSIQQAIKTGLTEKASGWQQEIVTKDKAKVSSVAETILEGVEWAVFSLMLPGVFVGMFHLPSLFTPTHRDCAWSGSCVPGGVQDNLAEIGTLELRILKCQHVIVHGAKGAIRPMRQSVHLDSIDGHGPYRGR
jgi:hypothetical protein